MLQEASLNLSKVVDLPCLFLVFCINTQFSNNNLTILKILSFTDYSGPFAKETDVIFCTWQRVNGDRKGIGFPKVAKQ